MSRRHRRPRSARRGSPRCCARASRGGSRTLPWRFVVRHGIANVDRPGNQTRAVVLALGFGAFLLGTLALVQGNLLRQLASTANASAANLAFFDVQTDQVGASRQSARARDSLPVLSRTPIVPMRIAAYHSRKPVVRAPERQRDAGETSNGDPDANRPSWAVRREYRSSYRDSVTSSEKIVAGKWWTSAGTRRGWRVRDLARAESRRGAGGDRGGHDHVGCAGRAHSDEGHEPARGAVGAFRAELLRRLPVCGAARGAAVVRSAHAGER